MLLRGQGFVEGVLNIMFNKRQAQKRAIFACTMDKIATQGRFSELTILWAKVDLPEPELPAMPIMLVSAQGGE